ncbi:unnamed protein product [Linum tenue]|uniref:LOB domain-containing protein n=1 Tax=Linum tenue TaxID=586396 RepID=A0AAV0RBF1_9ROSI|nr:unnamed protein product [Linum tenue]
MSHSQQPCAACKLQRRKCTQECIFAPHFPPDQPQKFANIHKVFGASNVAKLLSELPATHREEAVNSLAYEADARLKDPVYGCLGQISILQHRLKQLHMDLDAAKQELVKYMGPQAHHFPALIPNTTNNNHNNSAFPQNNNNMIHMVGIPAAHHQQQQQQSSSSNNNNNSAQQIYEAQLLATELAAREQQEMFRAYEQNQQRHHHHINHDQEVIGFGSGLMDGGGVTATGFNGVPSASLALGNIGHGTSAYQGQQQAVVELKPQLFLQQQQQHLQEEQQQERSAGSEERGRSIGPSA